MRFRLRHLYAFRNIVLWFLLGVGAALALFLLPSKTGTNLFSGGTAHVEAGHPGIHMTAESLLTGQLLSMDVTANSGHDGVRVVYDDGYFRSVLEWYFVTGETPRVCLETGSLRICRPLPVELAPGIIEVPAQPTNRIIPPEPGTLI